MLALHCEIYIFDLTQMREDMTDESMQNQYSFAWLLQLHNDTSLLACAGGNLTRFLALIQCNTLRWHHYDYSLGTYLWWRHFHLGKDNRSFSPDSQGNLNVNFIQFCFQKARQSRLPSADFPFPVIPGNQITNFSDLKLRFQSLGIFDGGIITYEKTTGHFLLDF